MTRDEVHAKFRAARASLERFRLTASPIYMEFLRGERELTCAAWANPTYNVRGWRGPCYLLGDAHYQTYRELVEPPTGAGSAPAAIRAAQHCLTHCGFEPAAVLTAAKRLRRRAADGRLADDVVVGGKSNPLECTLHLRANAFGPLHSSPA